MDDVFLGIMFLLMFLIPVAVVFVYYLLGVLERKKEKKSKEVNIRLIPFGIVGFFLCAIGIFCVYSSLFMITVNYDLGVIIGWTGMSMIIIGGLLVNIFGFKKNNHLN